MEKNKIIEMVQLLKDLEVFLEKNGDNSITNQINILKRANRNISIANDDVDIIQTEIAEAYRLLFANRGGLSEFYIWDNNYQDRMQKNEPFDNIKEKMWNIMKNYK